MRWLRAEQWDVYQEVRLGGPGGPICDVVAVRTPLVWAIETKLRFGVAVLEQALGWLPYAHLVSVATQHARRNQVLDSWCDWRGIGWLVVWPSDIRELNRPQLRRRIDPRLAMALRPEHQTAAPAGTAGGGYHTGFRETCNRIAVVVKARPGITLRDLLADLQTTHYATKASARAGIAHWAAAGKIAGVRLERDGKLVRFYPL